MQLFYKIQTYVILSAQKKVKKDTDEHNKIASKQQNGHSKKPQTKTSKSEQKKLSKSKDKTQNDAKKEVPQKKKRESKAEQKITQKKVKRGRTTATDQKEDQSNKKEIQQKKQSAQKLNGKAQSVAKSASNKNKKVIGKRTASKKQDVKEASHSKQKRQKTDQNKESAIKNGKDDQKKQNERPKRNAQKVSKSVDEMQIDTSTKEEAKKKQAPKKAQSKAKKEEDDGVDKLRTRIVRRRRNFDDYSDDDDEDNYGKRGKKGGSKSLRPNIAQGIKIDKSIAKEFQVTIDEQQIHILDEFNAQIQNQQDSKLSNSDCCTRCANKNLIRAAKTNNMQLLKECLQSKKHVSQVFTVTEGPESRLNAMDYAFLNGNLKMVELLLEYDIKSSKIKRVSDKPYLFKEFDTGMVSEDTYGYQVNKVNMSRGSRQGNNAFLQEHKFDERSFRSYLRSDELHSRILHSEHFNLDYFQNLLQIDPSLKRSYEGQRFFKLLLAGKTDIALSIIEKYENDPTAQVNQLMVEVLRAKLTSDLPKHYNKLSVTKTSQKFGGISSILLAALNENEEIFKKLYGMIKNNANFIYTRDNNECTAAHFAAANKNSEVLKFIVKNQKTLQNLAGTDNNITPIFVSVYNNLPKNIEVLLNNDCDSAYYKDSHGNMPIHIAARLGYVQIIRILAEFDKHSVNFLSAYHKVSPLMQAASQGHLDAVKFLIDVCKCNINQVDRYSRTALIYAIRNGHVEIASYLIKSNIFLHCPDSSLNSPLHYACAYGQQAIAQLLLKCGADINSLNEWKYSPLLIALLKNHQSITTFLLNWNENDQQADVNGTDEEGKTILSFAVQQIDDDSLRFIKFLVKDKKAEVNKADVFYRTPLFYLIKATLPSKISKIKDIQDIEHPEQGYLLRIKKEEQIVVDIFKYLVNEAKANVDVVDKNGNSLVSDSFSYQKLFLLPFLKDQFDINRDPKILFSFNPITDFENVMSCLKSHGRIEDQWLNCLYDYQDTPLFYYIKHFTTQFSVNNQIDNYLYIRRIIAFIQDNEEVINKYYDEFMDMQNLTKVKENNEAQQNVNYSQPWQARKFQGRAGLFNQYQQPAPKIQNAVNDNEIIINTDISKLSSAVEKEFVKELVIKKPAETFYLDLLDKELNNINLVIVLQCLSLQDIKRNYPARLFDLILLKIDKDENYKANSKIKELGVHRKKYVELLKQEKVVQPFLKFLKALIVKGADPNVCSFNKAYFDDLKQKQGFDLQLEDVSKESKKEIHPFTRIESEKHSKNFAQFYEQLSKIQSFKKQEIVSLLVKSRNLELLEFILDQGVDVNQTNEFGETVLIQMTKDFAQFDIEYYKDVFRVISKHKIDKSRRDLNQNTAFLLAYLNNKVEIATYLIEEGGLDPNAFNKQKETALLHAVKNNKSDMVELLLEKGANANITDTKGRTALHYAVNNSSSTIDASFDMENLLLSFGADPNIQDKRLRTPLHYAFVKIGKGNQEVSQMDPIETVSSLCTARNIDPSIQDKYGKTALHYAAQRGATISSMYLEKKGVNLQSKDIFGNTPLATAMLNKHSQYAIMLIKQGSDVNQLVHPENKDIYDKYMKKLKKQNQKQKEEKKNEDEDKNVESDDSYFNGQNNLNRNSTFGATSYQYGTVNYYAQQVQQKAIDLQKEETMFKLAVMNGELGLSYLILDSGFNIFNAMEDTLQQQKFSLVLTLLQKVTDVKKIQGQNAQGRTLFHIFAQYASSLNETHKKSELVKIINQFKRRDISIKSTDNSGRLPLHYACFSGAYSLVEEIIKDENYQLDLKDKEGFTPLISSIKGDNILKENNFQAFKLLANTGKVNINQYYYESGDSEFDNSLTRELQLAKKKCQTTPFLHLIRKLNDCAENVATNWLNYFLIQYNNELEDVEIKEKISIFQQDTFGRDAIMLLALENNLTYVKKIFQLLEDQEEQIIVDIVQNQDILGRTVIHFVAKANPLGTYDNAEMFSFLVKKGFEYDRANNDGQRPIDLLANVKNSKIFRKLEKLGVKVSEQKKDQKQIVQQEKQKEVKQPDFVQDSNKFLEENKDKYMVEKEVKKVQPDPIGQFGEGCEVVYENADNQDSAYDIYLIKVDTKGRYYFGGTLFYKMQLVHDKNKDIYIVLTKWGAITEAGMCQKTPFNKFEDALAEFKKIFKSKTSNNWDTAKEEFVIPKAKGKYVIYTFQKPKFTYKNLLLPYENFDNLPKSQLQQDQQHFMKLITNIGIYQEVLKINNIEQSQINLTSISQANIEKAQEIISEIEELLNMTVNMYNYHGKGDKNLSQEEIQNKILILSRQFYQLIPIREIADIGLNNNQNNYGLVAQNINSNQQESKIPQPVNRNTLAAFKSKVFDMATMERASRMLLGAQYRQNQISPLDYVYNSLNITINKLHDYESEYSIITQFMKNTGQTQFINYKVSDIYRINKHSEERVFREKHFEKDPLRMLLFHGTGHQNLLGILDCGLKITPAGIMQHGQAFGTGVYFSDQFDKSIMYSRSLTQHQVNQARLQNQNAQLGGSSRQFLLICEVAFGKLLGYNYYNDFGAIGTKKQLKVIDQQLIDMVKDKKKAKEEKVIESDSDQDMYDSDEDYSEDEDKVAEVDDEDEELDLDDKEEVKTAAQKKKIEELKFKKVPPAQTIRGCKVRQLNHVEAQHAEIFDTMWVKSQATPDPSYALLMDDGCIVQQGKIKQNSSGYYGGGGSASEFVVKNTERVKIRYIVELQTKKPDEILNEKKKNLLARRAKNQNLSDDEDMEDEEDSNNNGEEY